MEEKHSSQWVTSMFFTDSSILSHTIPRLPPSRNPLNTNLFLFAWKLTKLCSLAKLLFLLESSITGEWILSYFRPSLQLNTKENIALVFKSMCSDHNIFSPACPCHESVQLLEITCLNSQHHKKPLPKFICRRCHFWAAWRCIWWQRRMKGWWKQAATRTAATWAVFLQSHRASWKPAALPRQRTSLVEESSGFLSLDLLCLGFTALTKQEQTIITKPEEAHPRITSAIGRYSIDACRLRLWVDTRSSDFKQ